MALLTYADLQAAVADYLNRDDLTTQIVTFITLAETKIARRVRRKTVRAAFTVTAESTTLPDDCAELRSAVPVTGSPTRDLPLTIGTVSMLADRNALISKTPGRPALASVVDGNLVVAPPPDQNYTLEITYFQKLVPLSDTNATNFIFAEAPDIYLYGALTEAAPYLEHDERIQLWASLFSASIDELNDVREREEFAAKLSKSRLPVVF